MSDAASHIAALALGLPPKERATIAAGLLTSMDGAPDDGVDAAWEAEIQRRLASDESNDIEWNDLRAEVDAKYGYK